MSISPKELVGRKAAELVKDGMVLGLGSGTTVAEFVKSLGERVREEGLIVYVVPTSLDSEIMAVEYGLHVVTLTEYPEPDLAVDGADEVDPYKNLIKGGGGAMTREKIVDYAAKRLVIIVDEGKLVKNLCEKKPIPIEVLSFSWKCVMKKLEKLGGSASLRLCGGGKLGPIVTDNGNLIIDYRPKGGFDAKALNQALKDIPGVVETGLFTGDKVDTVMVGYRNGEIGKL